MRILVFIISLAIFPSSLAGPEPCTTILPDVPLSTRTTNYTMDVVLDEVNHQVQGFSTVEWINRSPESVNTARLYMYLNAFSSQETSYLRTGRGVGADQASDRAASDWGWIQVLDPRQSSLSILDQNYVSPDDGNEKDQSVLELVLEEAVAPGDTLILSFDFDAKLPRIMARSGFAEHGFMHWVHWYPKLGVYEQDRAGNWGWNCHQFLPQMEFYGDHGNYNVSIDAPSDWTLGGSGCITVTQENVERSLYRFAAHDVIDFAWVASPHLAVMEHQWKDVHIRYLYPPSHSGHVDRLLQAATFGLDYMHEFVGPYPYANLTILDPPVYALRSGFMEYPTYITGGSFYAWPTQIRTIESLVLHEFAHQYFMQILANNEKEEPWLDEGFVTYYEDRIMEAMLGEHSSLFDILGYHVSNSQFTRNEYVSIAETDTDPIASNSWEIDGPYKGIIYSKTATLLKTIERYMGRELFDRMMQSYVDQHKFSHPRGEDFLQILRQFFPEDNILTPYFESFIKEAIYGTGTCDYSVEDIQQVEVANGYAHTVRLKGTGDLKLPVEVMISYEDGLDQIIVWDGQEQTHVIELLDNRKIRSVEIDPNRKNLLDLDLNNNSFSTHPGKLGPTKYASKFAFWFQQISNTLGVLL